MPKKKAIITEQRVVLPNISWFQFEQLIEELGIERTSRLTYLRGRLELMTPIEAHERCSKLLESLILVLIDELGMDVESIAPILLKYEEYDCATETDAGYYFHDWQPQASNIITLPIDPPPDLLIEVALTKSTIDKLPIYAAMGVPEIWRYLTTPGDDVLKGNLLIYQLDDTQYEATPKSGIFPFLSSDRILEFLEQSDTMSLAKALQILRVWLKDKI